MDPVLIILISAIIILAIIAIPIINKANVAKLKMLPEEKILLDQKKISYRAHFGNMPQKNFGARIQVTNKRIILSQKALLLPDTDRGYVLRHVINYTGNGEPMKMSDMSGGFLFKGGYVTLHATPSQMLKVKKGKKDALRIEIKATKNIKPLFGDGEIFIYTNKIDDILKIVKNK